MTEHFVGGGGGRGVEAKVSGNQGVKIPGKSLRQGNFHVKCLRLAVACVEMLWRWAGALGMNHLLSEVWLFNSET